MNKVNFNRAYELYKEKYKSDYGWKICLTYEMGREQIAILEYEDKKYPYRIEIVVSKHIIQCIPFFGCLSKFVWKDDFNNIIDAIVYLMICSTIQIAIFTLLKNYEKLVLKADEYELPQELNQIQNEEWEKLSNITR